MTDAVKIVLNEVKQIASFDDLERDHIDDAIQWITNDGNIFRISKPDNPPKHLVSYFVIYDKTTKKIMLIDHLKARAWLPSGGHVEIDEDPKVTVEREAYEELKLVSKFDVIGGQPLFITVTKTKPPHTHTDVSLWYVISGDSKATYDFDASEMNGYRWFGIDEIMNMEIEFLDPHMKRFTHKFTQSINL